MNPRHIAQALGGDVAGPNQIIAPGPGHSPRDRSLSIRIDASAPDGFVVFSHAGDDPLAAKDYVKQRLGIETSRRRDNSVPRTSCHREVSDDRYHTAIDAERTALAMRIWREAVEPSGTPIEAYLAGRGLALPKAAVRWHPNCPFGKIRIGCKIGRAHV